MQLLVDVYGNVTDFAIGETRYNWTFLLNNITCHQQMIVVVVVFGVVVVSLCIFITGSFSLLNNTENILCREVEIGIMFIWYFDQWHLGCRFIVVTLFFSDCTNCFVFHWLLFEGDVIILQ